MLTPKMDHRPSGSARNNSITHNKSTATHSGALLIADAIATANAAIARSKKTVSI